MVVPSERRALNAYLSDDAYEGWRLFASSQRVSVTSLVEAIGLMLADVDEAKPPPWLRKAVRDAAKVDADRRSRTRMGRST